MGNKIHILLYIQVIFFLSCTENNENECYSNLTDFKFSSGECVKFHDITSIDSKNYFFTLGEDTVYTEIGFYCSSLTERSKKLIVEMEGNILEDSMKTDGEMELIFIKYGQNQDLDYYRKQNMSFKYIFPKNTQKHPKTFLPHTYAI